MIFQRIIENARHVHDFGGYAALYGGGFLALAGIVLVGFGIYRGFFKQVGATSILDFSSLVNGVVSLIELLAGPLALALSWIVLSSAFGG